jgi:hypothetical protein
MLASITPLGEQGRNRRWGVTAPSFLAGSALGGALVGLSAGAAGAAVLAVVPLGTGGRLAVLAVGLVAALAVDLLPGRTRAPGPKRQVNEDWLEVYREWVYGAGFGLQLGAALLTQVATAAVYAMLLAAALTGSLAGGALVGGVFGLVRALPVLATRSVRDAPSLRRLHRRTAALAEPVRRATLGTLGSTGVVVAVLAATGGGGSA